MDARFDRARRWVTHPDVLIAVGLLLLAGLVIQEWSAQAAPRYLLSVAVVEDRTLELDRYESLLGVDQARYRDHVYLDKAPYQPLAAVAPLALHRLAGREALPDDWERTGVDGLFQAKLDGLWWVSLWSSTIPAIGLAVLVRRQLTRQHPALAAPVAVAMATGTILLPFASVLFGHVLAALLVAGAWAFLGRAGASVRDGALAGLCLGAAIGTEFVAAALAVVFFLAAVRRVTVGLAVLAGTAVAALPLLVYNHLVFENPFEVAYQGHLPNFQGQGALGVYNLQIPQLREVGRALVGPEGLFTLTPVMLVAVIGCVYALRSGGRDRRHAIVALVSLVVMVVLSTGIDGIGGDSPGPRYLIPVLPLFALPLAVAWRRHPLPALVATVFGAVWMTMATLTDPLGNNAHTWVDRVISGDLGTNIVTGRGASWPLYLAAIGAWLILGRMLCLRAIDATRGPTVGDQLPRS